jgi:hypothetical protein
MGGQSPAQGFEGAYAYSGEGWAPGDDISLLTEGFGRPHGAWRHPLGFMRDAGFSLWGKWAGRGNPIGFGGAERGNTREGGTLSTISERGHEPKRGLAAQPAELGSAAAGKAREVRGGDKALSTAQRGVRMAFFVWLSV